MFYELKRQIEYFLKNKIYMASLIIAAIAGYGYEITHSSLGIDDVCIGLYFDDGLGVSIGRWPFYVINKIFHVTEFEPFILEFIAVLIFMFAAIVWSAVLRYVLGDKLPIACYAVFSAMLLDYSLIAEVFIYYLQNGVPIIYAIVAVAVFDFYYLYTHNLEQKQRILHKFGMSLIVSVAIGFYEAAANVFLTGMLLIMIVDCFGANRMQIRKFKQFFMSLFLIGRILVYAILERSLITRACMAVFGIEPYSYRSAGSMLRILKYPGRILTIIRQILRDYVFVGLAYYLIICGSKYFIRDYHSCSCSEKKECVYPVSWYPLLRIYFHTIASTGGCTSLSFESDDRITGCDGIVLSDVPDIEVQISACECCRNDSGDRSSVQFCF